MKSPLSDLPDKQGSVRKEDQSQQLISLDPQLQIADGGQMMRR
jgi:hypothetical protein